MRKRTKQGTSTPSLLVAASYEEGKEEEERIRRKGNGRKEVKKLAAGERKNQRRCYRHEDEKHLFQMQSSLHGLGEKKCYQKEMQEAILPFRNKWSTQES